MTSNNNPNPNPNLDPAQSFWDFMQAMQANRPAHGAGFPFGPEGSPFNFWAGGPGRHGRHGRHHSHHRRGGHESDRDENHDEFDHSDMDDSPETMRDSPDGPSGPPPPPPPPGPAGAPHMPPPPPGPAGIPSHPPHPLFPHPPPHHGRHVFGGPGMRRRGGRCGGPGGRGRDRHGPTPFDGPWDFRPLMHVLATHPFAQGLRDYVEQQTRSGAPPAAAATTPMAAAEEQADDTFTPPVDIFNTEKAFVLHVALPGANKEDVGVNWDPDRSLLNVAGVVHRPGNEEFLQCLSSSERKVGMFERSIKLPPPESDDKEEVDAFGITAKMENGILIVIVPKSEKEWTEIHKIDIE